MLESHAIWPSIQLLDLCHIRMSFPTLLISFQTIDGGEISFPVEFDKPLTYFKKLFFSHSISYQTITQLKIFISISC